MEIYLEEGQDLGREQMDKLRKAAEILLRQEGIDSSRAELSLTIVEPEEIRELNREYRGVDKVTDVLSFPQFENMGEMPSDGEICLGDVVICDEKYDSRPRNTAILMTGSWCICLFTAFSIWQDMIIWKRMKNYNEDQGRRDYAAG